MISVRAVEYFNTQVEDKPGEAYHLLAEMEKAGVSLLAFSAIPTGGAHTQLMLFPQSVAKLAQAAEASALTLDGPHRALLVQGDDHLGAVASIHRKLFDAGVNVYASSGVSDDRGGFGYVVYVRPEDFKAAAQALGL